MPDRLLQVLEIHWNELRKLRKDILGRWHPEDIHDLRVATRRFRAVLQLVEPLCHRRRLRKLRRVRRLTGKLGFLRNLDEAIGFFENRLGAGELVERLTGLRKAEQRKAARALEEFRGRGCGRAVRRLCRGKGIKTSGYGRMTPLQTYLHEISAERWDAVRRAVTASLVRENVEQRHELRIVIKKLRYFLEIAAPLLGWRSEQPLALLRRYQGLLGRMNDLTVFEELAAGTGIDEEQLSAVEKLIAEEHERLFSEWQALVAAEPLERIFHMTADFPDWSDSSREQTGEPAWCKGRVWLS